MVKKTTDEILPETLILWVWDGEGASRDENIACRVMEKALFLSLRPEEQMLVADDREDATQLEQDLKSMGWIITKTFNEELRRLKKWEKP